VYYSLMISHMTSTTLASFGLRNEYFIEKLNSYYYE